MPPGAVRVLALTDTSLNRRGGWGGNMISDQGPRWPCGPESLVGVRRDGVSAVVV